MKIGVIGCGLIGRKRAAALPSSATLVGCFDVLPDTAKNFSDEFRVPTFDSISEMTNSAGNSVSVSFTGVQGSVNTVRADFKFHIKQKVTVKVLK